MPTVKLSPIFNDQTVTTEGAPASGYKVYTYQAGSSTAQATYTDSAGTVAQSNPIILNASGYPTTGQVWLQSGLAYKFVLQDANGVTIKSFDNISGVNDTTTSVSQWGASGVTPTYISSTSFSLPGDQTSEFHVGRRVQATVTAGTVYGTIASTSYNGTSLTTVGLTMDGSGVLDAGLSAVNLGILRADTPAIPVAQALINTKKGADVASAATINLSTTTGDWCDVTGTTAITAITLAEGYTRAVRFTGALTLTNGASLVNVTGANITTEAGDWAIFRGYASGVVRMSSYMRASGYPLTNSSRPGELFDWPHASTPSHGLLCNGAAVSRTTYAALYAAIGTTWGSGDGSTTFNLPNIPANYTTVQASANVGTSTVGDVIAHTHVQNVENTANTGAGLYPRGSTIGTGTAQDSFYSTDSAGGAANLAAGVRVLKCIRF